MDEMVRRGAGRFPLETGVPRRVPRHRGGVSPLAWLSMLLAMVLLSGCSRSDPEEALRAAVEGLRQAVEARDPAAVQQFLAEDFIGNDGLDREGARRLATALMLRHREVSSTLGPLDVRIRDSHADVRFQAVLHAGTGSLLPDTAQAYDVQASWRLEGGDWRLYHVRWTPVL